MNEEYIEKMLQRFEYLQRVSEEIENTIDLLKDSNELDSNTIAKATVFLEGYRTGLKNKLNG